MKKNIIKILSSVLIIGNLFSIPVNAKVDSNKLHYYENEIQVISEYYYEASRAANTGRLQTSKENSEKLLNDIKQYINDNTIQEFQDKCKIIEDVMEKYEKFKYDEVFQLYQLGGGGSGCGRDQVRKEVEIELDTCKLLLDEINRYNNSFEYYVKETDPEHKYWKQEDGNWYYYDYDGEKVKNTIVDGYILDKNGKLTLY